MAVERWDSLAFQFPNWSLRLPGYDYDGPHTDGFASHREVSARIAEYAALTRAPVRTQVEVLSLDTSTGGFRLETPSGTLNARQVVLATGPFQRPSVPSFAADIAPHIVQLHSSRYRVPAQLPPGAVLVVGSGGSGAQITEELYRSGRTVYLSVSRHRGCRDAGTAATCCGGCSKWDGWTAPRPRCPTVDSRPRCSSRERRAGMTLTFAGSTVMG